MSTNSELIQELKEYAEINNVPIMIEDTLNYIIDIIKKNNVKSVLEVGTAIAYSTIILSDYVEDITSIERDENRYNLAINNVKRSNKNNIKLILGDALDVNIEPKYDLIIIDTAKSQNIKFFDKYKNNLNDSGILIVDNMNFHGLVHSKEYIESKNLRSMVKKLEMFWNYIDSVSGFDVKHLDIGDGIVVCKKINI